MPDETKPEEPLAYALEPEDRDKLKAISARLNSPRALSFDNRRDLANLIDLICSRSIPINEAL